MEVSQGAAWKSLQLLMLLEVKCISFLKFIKEVNFPRSQLVAFQKKKEVFNVSVHASLHGSITHGVSSGVFNLSVFKTTCCCVIF